MPELLEVELYRRTASRIVGRTVAAVAAPDDWYLKGCDATQVAIALCGARVESLDRIGKLLIVETSAITVGLRFGMTGRLVVDEEAAIERLEYSSRHMHPDWNRFAMRFEEGGSLVMNDPRRLGGVELDPDVSRLGPDAWSVSAADLIALFSRYRVATKALLLDQQRVAGLGNLLVDEVLWRTGTAPSRPVDEVSTAEVRALGEELPRMLDELWVRGGSHCGDLFPERHRGGRCPRDGAELAHSTVGGRSTWWCATHQH